MNKKEYTKPPTFWNIFVFILLIIFIGFGGGNAIMPVIKRYAVDKYKWLDEDEFHQNVVLTNMLPGPAAIQTTAYIAFKSLSKFKAYLVVCLASMPHTFFAVGLIFAFNKIPTQYLVVVQIGVLVAITGALLGFGYNYFKKGRKVMKLSLWIILFLTTLIFSLFIPTPYNVPVLVMILVIAIYSTVFIIRTKKAKKIDNDEIKKGIK
ncbi:chromate transporter [Mycoplasma feriruminatoris]|uniref:Chromate transporter n=1 Tax=Mycoplasma feriruminatoris TaxID=1179777 RepID=A0ABY8HVT8_9MOLU|nr:chromate transporter [Mycoplasma feriruminatoris]WFQ93739.1 chromate transporter [Mycoplasma feriruminatoris]